MKKWCSNHGYVEEPKLEKPPTPAPDTDQMVKEMVADCPKCGYPLRTPEECGCVIVNKGGPAEFTMHQCPFHEGVQTGLQMGPVDDDLSESDERRFLLGLVNGIQRACQISSF